MSAKSRHGPVGHDNAHGLMVDRVDVMARHLDMT
jgi:hypothetical protein